MKKSQLNIRCTDEEKAEWEEAAKLAGLTLTAWIAQTLRQAAVTALKGSAFLASPHGASPAIRESSRPVAPPAKQSDGRCDACRRKNVTSAGACTLPHCSNYRKR